MPLFMNRKKINLKRERGRRRGGEEEVGGMTEGREKEKARRLGKKKILNLLPRNRFF